MGIMDLFKRKKEEAIELPVEEEAPAGKITVRIENLASIADVERFERLLREGNILLLKVKELQKRDLGQFKNAVERLKRRCMQYGWDIVGIEDGYLVLAPKFAKIER